MTVQTCPWIYGVYFLTPWIWVVHAICLGQWDTGTHDSADVWKTFVNQRRTKHLPTARHATEAILNHLDLVTPLVNHGHMKKLGREGLSWTQPVEPPIEPTELRAEPKGGCLKPLGFKVVCSKTTSEHPWNYTMWVCVIVVSWVFIKLESLVNENISDITLQINMRLEIYRGHSISKARRIVFLNF